MKLTQELLNKIVDVIVRTADPEKVVLFGSRAKGNERSDSDLDLLVIESEPFDKNRSRRKEMARLWRALAGFDIPKDILVYSKSEAEYWQDSLNNVVAKALKEGTILYERS